MVLYPAIFSMGEDWNPKTFLNVTATGSAPSA